MKLLQSVTLAALCAAGFQHPQAQAQAQTVTLYGLLDTGVEHISNVGAGRSGLWRMPTNTGTAPSRLGFRGSEDLGGGLRAVFTLEMGIAPDTGGLNQGGRAFGRQAFVGLSGAFGTVSLGRQYTMTFWSGLDADILGGNIFGTGSLDAYLPNARTDNAIAYRGTFSGLTLGGTYSLGRDTVNAGPSPAGTNCAGENAADKRACREWSVMAKYDSPGWGVALANDKLYGRTVGAAPDAVFGGLNSSGKSDTRLVLNGYARFAGVKLGGGVLRRTNDGSAIQPKSDLWHVGVSAPFGSWVLDAQVLKLKYKNIGDRDSTLFAARGSYNFSKRTAAYVQAARIRNDALAAVSVSGGAPGSNPVAGVAQDGLSVGLRHTF